jgi:hypothetical protein
MKKLLPFLFPAVALLIVVFLAFRWYNSRTARPDGKISQFAENQTIESLSQAEMNKFRRPVKDLSTVELTGADNVTGNVRYEVVDGKISFTVNANLPELKEGVYQVWLKEVNGDAKRKAFTLELEKGGYTGSAAISSETLPFEVVISKEMNAKDDLMELILLKGVIQKDTAVKKN